MKKIKICSAAISDKGNFKNSNQDRVLVKIGNLNGDDFGLFVIADGVGGLSDGEIASEICTDSMRQWWQDVLIKELGTVDIKTIGKSMAERIEEINRKILLYGKTTQRQLGTTMTALVLYKHEFVINHIGDSRAYKLEKGMKQLTKDHTWLEQQIDFQTMSLVEVMNHPKRNHLTQCLGYKEAIDIFQIDGRLKENEMFLLCTDGFYRKIQSNDLEGLLINKEQLTDEDLQEIIDELTSIFRQRGEKDNISSIMISFRSLGWFKQFLENRSWVTNE